MVSDNYQHVIYWLVFYPGILIALLPSIIHRIPSTFPSCEVHAELTSDELKRQLFFFFAVIVGCDVVFLFDALFFLLDLLDWLKDWLGWLDWLVFWWVVVVVVVCSGCGGCGLLWLWVVGCCCGVFHYLCFHALTETEVLCTVI